MRRRTRTSPEARRERASLRGGGRRAGEGRLSSALLNGSGSPAFPQLARVDSNRHRRFQSPRRSETRTRNSFEIHGFSGSGRFTYPEKRTPHVLKIHVESPHELISGIFDDAGAAWLGSRQCAERSSTNPPGSILSRARRQRCAPPCRRRGASEWSTGPSCHASRSAWRGSCWRVVRTGHMASRPSTAVPGRCHQQRNLGRRGNGDRSEGRAAVPAARRADRGHDRRDRDATIPGVAEEEPAGGTGARLPPVRTCRGRDRADVRVPAAGPEPARDCSRGILIPISPTRRVCRVRRARDTHPRGRAALPGWRPATGSTCRAPTPPARRPAQPCGSGRPAPG